MIQATPMPRRVLLGAGGAALAAPMLAPGLAHAQGKSVLRFVPQADLAILDPIWTTATVTNTHAHMVFDTLYGLDEDYAPHPQMVAGHTIDNDGKTWTLTLRDGLRFHDGEPVRGRDCVASIRRWGARDMFGQEILLVADEISAPTDKTIRFRLKKPFPLLPKALGKIMPSICAIMPERLAQTDPGKQVTEMIGSGPYRFVASERIAGAKAVYTKFDGYVPRPDGIPSRTAGPKRVYFDRVEWQVIPDQATAAAAIQAGEVDWLDITGSDLLPLYKRNPEVEAGYAEDRNTYILRFNHLHPPFNNAAIRRALLGAVNQKDFMTAAFGEDPAGWRIGTGYFLSGTPMASKAGLEALTEKPDYDKVKRDLAAAGYKGEKVVFLQAEDYPSLKALAEVGVDMMRKAGMNVDVQSSDWGSLVRRRANNETSDKGGWDVFITGTSTSLDPSGHLGLRSNGLKAWFGWPSSPKLEALRQEWFAAPDLAAQQKVTREMQLQAFQDVPYLPLGEALRLSAHRKDLAGFHVGAVVFYDLKRV